MIEVKYGLIEDGLFNNYLNFLISRFFKILPLKEEKFSTLQEYLESLQRELIGNADLIAMLKNDPSFLSLLGKIQYFVQNPDQDVSIYKKEVFASIKIIQTLQSKYGGV